MGKGGRERRRDGQRGERKEKVAVVEEERGREKGKGKLRRDKRRSE